MRQLPDAPALLYCRGDGSLLRAPAFAVVGSRRATAQGKAVAAYMARCLSACGVTIVSGMAQGIDCVAHEAALGRVGRSIGVLGTGIDVRYPACNAGVFAAMEREGLLVSEFPPGAPPLPTNFPVRNRIISGLALGVLVAEAASRSGSLVTARLALEQNREVYAVPGPALDAHCLGSQDLVRQGARPVFNAEDVLRDLAGSAAALRHRAGNSARRGTGSLAGGLRLPVLPPPMSRVASFRTRTLALSPPAGTSRLTGPRKIKLRLQGLRQIRERGP